MRDAHTHLHDNMKLNMCVGAQRAHTQIAFRLFSLLGEPWSASLPGGNQVDGLPPVGNMQEGLLIMDIGFRATYL